jgi:hypothetical protein
MSPAIARAEYLERDEKLLAMPRAILHYYFRLPPEILKILRLQP